MAEVIYILNLNQMKQNLRGDWLAQELYKS